MSRINLGRALAIIGALFFVVGCTNPLKDKAQEDARQLFVKDLAIKVQKLLPMDHELAGDYQAFIGKKTDVEVEAVEESAGGANVQVKIQSIPLKNLVVLADIAGKQHGSKASKFNMGNAIQLIEQQEGMVKGKEETQFILIYRKSGDQYVFDKLEPLKKQDSK